METAKEIVNGLEVAVILSDEIVLTDEQSALDFIMSARYESDCDRIALCKEAISEDFFRLSTGLAGSILQKFANYRLKLAVYGDFSSYTSKSTRDFIYECNRGNAVFFVATREEAVQMLANA